jgi:hypothetical protein
MNFYAAAKGDRDNAPKPERVTLAQLVKLAIIAFVFTR